MVLNLRGPVKLRHLSSALRVSSGTTLSLGTVHGTMRARVLWVLCLAVGACGGPAVGTSSRAELVAVEVTPADADAAARGLSASIDPRAGLVVVAHLEDASDGEGPPLPQSGLRCGQAIDELAASLSDYVSYRHTSGEPVVWRCVGDRCELRGVMEFDPTRVLRFGRDAGGSLVVTGLDLFEDVGSEDIRAQLDAEHASLRGRCPSLATLRGGVSPRAR